VGLLVDSVGDGAQALAQVDPARHEVVLMDLQMPVLDGLSATRQMRQRPELAQLPIVALTANAFDEDKAACLAADMNDFVGKPVQPEALYHCLLTWLPTVAQPAQAMAVPPAAPEPAPTDALPAWVGRVAAVPGMDPDLGLRMVRGNHALYLHVLRLFLRNHLDDPAALRQAADAADLAALHRLAHSLKGLGGTVGAPGLTALATELDGNARRPEPDLPTCQRQAAALADTLQRQLAALGQALADPSGEATPGR
jgi:CheY-like chemotaxis protein